MHTYMHRYTPPLQECIIRVPWNTKLRFIVPPRGKEWNAAISSDIQNFIHTQTQKKEVLTKQHTFSTNEEMEMSCELGNFTDGERALSTGNETRVNTEAGVGTAEKISSAPPENRTAIV
jgi:hypothetical protein